MSTLSFNWPLGCLQAWAFKESLKILKNMCVIVFFVVIYVLCSKCDRPLSIKRILHREQRVATCSRIQVASLIARLGFVKELQHRLGFGCFLLLEEIF